MDFFDRNFDEPVTISPSGMTRSLWLKALDVSLGDVAALVAPDHIFLCEGESGGSPLSAKTSFDAECYTRIFGDNHPDVVFISIGNAETVVQGSQNVLRAITAIAPGTKIQKLIDRDSLSSNEVIKLEAIGVRVLSRRHIESFLLDPEIVERLCDSLGKSELTNEAQVLRTTALSNSVGRGNPADDIKSMSGEFQTKVTRLLNIQAGGNSREAFLRDTMAPLITAETVVYRLLHADLFGSNQITAGR